MKKGKKHSKYFCEDQFLKNRVASATDATGYAVTVPATDSEAVNLSRLQGGIPTTSDRDNNTKS